MDNIHQSVVCVHLKRTKYRHRGRREIWGNGTHLVSIPEVSDICIIVEIFEFTLRLYDASRQSQSSCKDANKEKGIRKYGKKSDAHRCCSPRLRRR